MNPFESPSEIADVSRALSEGRDPDLGIADVWHNGTKSYYRAKLLKKLTLEEALFDPTGPPDGEPSSAPPANLLSAEQIAQKLANVGGIERWRLILQEWLDSYIAIWKEEESIWRGAQEVSPPSPEIQKEPKCQP